ncbi:MAG: MFS transporter [bacterium]
MGLKMKITDTLTEEETQAGLRAVILEGLASQTVGTLAGGVFLIAFALKLGASNLMVGILAAVLPLGQLIQIPSVYIVEKYRTRRAITVYALIMARIALLFIVFIPFLFSSNLGLVFLIIAMAVNSGFAAVSVCAWNPWMRDLVPQNQLGAFFSKRMSLAMMVAIPLSMVSGVYLDYWKKSFPNLEIYGYSFLFLFAFLVGTAGIYYLIITPEPRMASCSKKPKFFNLIAEPFADRNFRNLTFFLGLWSFATNLVIPFFTVYMLKRLQLNMSVVITLTVLSQMFNLAFLRTWGRLSDLFSYKSVLSINALLFAFCTLAWTFTTLPDRHLMTFPLLIVIHILIGVSMAGYILAADNLALKLAPRDKATAYLATKNLVNSLSAGIAPIIGGRFADFFTRYEFSWRLTLIGPQRGFNYQILNFEQLDFFFFFAFLIGLYAVYRLSMVREEGDVRGTVVLQALKSQMKGTLMSTARYIRVQLLPNRPGYRPIAIEEGGYQPIAIEEIRFQPITVEDEVPAAIEEEGALTLGDPEKSD